MKYWVYKDARILGPFDRSSMAGLPGIDSSTLVSVGEAAGAGEGDWRPAGEVAELAGLGLSRASWALLADGDIPATQGVLDRLQIDAAGLVGDEDFPALAEELFQDPVMKRGFADLLAPSAPAEEGELRRARDRAAELAARLESLHKKLNEVENSRAELMHRLIEREAQAGAAAPAPMPAPAPVSAPGPVEPPVAPPPPSAPAPTLAAPAAAPPPAPALPEIPPFAPVSETPALGGLPAPESAAPTPDLPTSAAETSAPAKAPLSFARKSFKAALTRKSFRVVDAAGAESGLAEPASASPTEPAPTPASVPAPASQAPAPLSASAPAPTATAPLSLEPPAPPTAGTPAPVSSQPPSPSPDLLFSAPPAAPAASPAPSSAFDELAMPASSAPPMTMRVAAGAGVEAPPAFSGPADAPAAEEVLARLARPPEPEPAPPRPSARSYKGFYLAGGLLLALLAGIGFFFRNPQEAQEMTGLTDGQPMLGAAEPAPEPDPGALPRPAPEPAPAPPPAPESAAQAQGGAALSSAIELVKGFPLDGDRGTVGPWLQYSYAASADAGREDWSASAKADGLFLVEYKVEPAPGSANPGVFYLFEADLERRLVLGKNPEARKLLAGAPPRPEPPARPRKAKARPKPRRPAAPAPREVPLLPLPSDGELRPPAEDDGAFRSDTIEGDGL